MAGDYGFFGVLVGVPSGAETRSNVESEVALNQLCELLLRFRTL